MYPSDYISFRTQTMTVEKLLNRLEDGDIEDRHVIYNLYSSINYSRFIESVITGLPLLPLIFDGSRAPWRIIDGAKRLSVIWNFANNNIQLLKTNDSRIPEYTYFEGMSIFLRNRFLDAPIPCYIINPGTPTYVIDDIQERIKTIL